ncbi:ATP-binding cassette domain-containing protein [Reichenbachiella sp. MALMAid0571]|uniref:ATP-binding cassette domain-containing protein n=1 Tax=Reichenbachiella sp. MALMAid0571 TaxID=3143939 RepID=UPI0032DFB375
MSEQLLRAIIELLAIVAIEDDVTEDERLSVENFLLQNLNKEETKKYMSQFDKFAASIEKKVLTGDFDSKEEISQLTSRINQELTVQQKIVVVLNLIELVIADGQVSDREKELVYHIGESFKFSSRVIDHIKAFVVNGEKEKLSSENILIIDAKPNDDTLASKYIFKEHLDGHLAFFRLPKLEIYFLKYIGNTSLFLNGIALRKNQIMVFSAGSTIRGNNISPIYYSDVVSTYREEHSDSKISFVAEDISFEFPNGKLGLRHINIAEETGKLIGLMGGSGAGKSTLLNVLNGNEKPSEGSVRINGIDIHKDSNKIEGVIGYVPQDDLMIDELTVFENLYYAAKLCFSEASESELTELVKKTLAALGLTETSNLKVGSPLEKTISGGQRKRLNIGLELLREPSVLFVDEPTSGLSSRDSENIMDLLKELSLKGKMVFVVIHQPSSDIFKMFDKLVILDVGGYQIYYGNPVEAVTYFKRIVDMIDKEQGSCIECGNVNPEQIFNIIETKVVDEYGHLTDTRKILPQDWNEYFNEHNKVEKINETATEPKKTLSIPGKIKQLLIFIKRDVATKISNKQYLVINFLEAPVLALLLAFIIRYTATGQDEYIFRENPNIPAFFFMAIIVSLFMGLTISAEEIIKDRRILKRESFLNLSRLSYLMSKMVILFSMSAVQTLLFVLIGDAILGIQGMTLSFWLVMFSVSCFANILGLNISSAFNSAVTIYILIPLLIIPQLILSGVVVSFDKLHPWLSNNSKVPVIGEMMASRWGYEALLVSQFKNNEYEKNFFEYDQVLANTEYKVAYYFSTLDSQLDFVNSNYRDKDEQNQLKIKNKLSLIRNELRKEMNLFNLPDSKFTTMDSLYIDKFSQSVFENTRRFMNIFKKIYNDQSKDAGKEKDALIASMMATPEGQEAYIKLKNDNENENVIFYLKNSIAEDRILNTGDELVRKIYPVYMEPIPNGFLDFRAHFYAPKKHFAGTYFDTLCFNIVVIWLMSIVLIFTLYFDVMRKFVTGFGK